jgi:hypothetical protein
VSERQLFFTHGRRITSSALQAFVQEDSFTYLLTPDAEVFVPGVDFMNQFWQQFCNLRTKLKMAQELLSMAV